MNPFFSIILPTYNRAHIIERALNSLLHQKFYHWEAWVMDDGSQDDTQAILQTYRMLDSRIHYQVVSHQGVSQARNQGISQAKGDVITFLDSDDEYFPHHLERHYQLLINLPRLEAVYGRVQCIGDPLVPDMKNLNHLIHIDDCIQVGTLFIYKTVLDRVGGFPETEFGEDYLLLQKILARGYQVMKSPFQTYRYFRDHEQSIVADKLKKSKVKRFLS